MRLFKYPPIESPVILINIGNKIKGLLYQKLESKKEKNLKKIGEKSNNTINPINPIPKKE
jgi:hypothetical protein